MKIAIVMLSYNRVEYTKKTIASYEKQIGGKDAFDFFVYDNGSTDGTAEYLKNYNGSLNLDVILGKENIGIARGTKLLLKEKCFGKGYDFIVKVDDDEILPDNWHNIFKYWDEIEALNCAFIGFKRKEINEYFEGEKWALRIPGNDKQILLGDFVCVRSIASPGVQASTEKWWKEVYHSLTDFTALYGGWDYTFMEALVKINKYFLVVMNYETDHFQREEDHYEFSLFKKREMLKFRRDHKIKWLKSKKQLDFILRNIEIIEKNYPSHPKLNELKLKANELKKKLDGRN